ncbi:MAG: radical SAM protein [Infirmifilum sp.]
MDETGLRTVLEELAPFVIPASPSGMVGVNEGLHFTGGEPFLNYPLLVRAVRLAEELGYPSVFVETNCFWCVSDELARARFSELKGAGLEGVLISANPFLVEHVPFERTERGLRAALEVFGPRNVLVYHDVYFRLLRGLSRGGTVRFEEFLDEGLKLNPQLVLLGFDPGLLLPMGRLVYKLEQLYEAKPARAFFGVSCRSQLTRDWHVHIDCYYNYIPGYCAGITLGDARRLKDLLEGIDLGDRPVLAALTRSLEDLYKLAAEGYGYRERERGYISPCHLCLDIRLHLALEVGGFAELGPRCFYESIADAAGKS